MTPMRLRRAGIGQAVALALALASAAGHADESEVLVNPFHDPVLQITRGMAACPVPEEPAYTREEYRRLAHERSQRGVSCWLAGRCRLPNGYLYDAEIIPRVKIALEQTQAYADTSVWALGQRRRVWLRGCVQSEEQSRSIEAAVRHLDDVEDVQNELMVGDRGTPPYVVQRP